MSTNKDLTFGLGENWRFTVSCHKADGITNLDLTGAVVECGISGRGGNLVASSPDNGITILTEETGTPFRTFINITPELQEGASLVAGEYDYVVRVTLQNGIKDDQVCGVLHIRDDTPLAA